MVELVWLIPALPLVGFVLLLLFGTRLGEPASGWLATLMVAASFIVALVAFVGLRDEPGDTFEQTLWSWMPVGDFQVDVGLLLDPLSMAMVLFITGIAALIHLYSIGYMHGDSRYPQFFLYLNLFVFSMLVLVLGNNLLLTFVGWEGVGTCSYLLISFWFEKGANASAGKKAFITNRVGDWGFMVGMFATFFAFGSITYTEFLPLAPGLAATTATFIAGMLFIGAIGKSAQIPLFVWLPDAMAGPTPVSALIHAATMVTAGVYLLCRVNPVLGSSYDWLPETIAWIGAITALLAATIATSQYDIKKVLAYSTVSQLGYMFLAVGIGAYWVAIFHMITHAFFKAVLFLGAGSVIHGMHDEQDIRLMGNLRRYMPITTVAFVAGALALAGVPPFSGFWSKDEILAYAWQENLPLWIVGTAAALLTAYYIGREVFLVFYGDERWKASLEAEAIAKADHAVIADDEAERPTVEPAPVEPAVVGAAPAPQADQVSAAHFPEGFRPHESPWVMTLPLIVLGLGATVAGLLNLPFPKSFHFLETWLEPVFEGTATELDLSAATIVALLVVGAAVALAGIGIAAAVFLQHRVEARKVEPALLQHAWYIDSSIAAFMGGPGREGFEATAAFDRGLIDGAVNGVGRVTRWGSSRLRFLQTGYVRSYALMIAVGSVLLVAFVLTRVLAWS
jgi:NADH-quinone oxidoreductase subunit L